MQPAEVKTELGHTLEQVLREGFKTLGYPEGHDAIHTEQLLAQLEVVPQEREGLWFSRVSRQVRLQDDEVATCHYDVNPQRQIDKECQNYAVANNHELASRIVNAVAPHWSATVRRTAADMARHVLDRTLTRMWDDICAFHAKFQLAYSGAPRLLDKELVEFRVNFLHEELQEYMDAYGVWVRQPSGKWALVEPAPDTIENRSKALDALVDLVYVAFGTAYLHGFNFAEAWRRVQRANMAKVKVQRLDDSKRGSKFDVVKPEGWQAPNHDDLVGVVEEPKPVQAELL